MHHAAAKKTSTKQHTNNRSRLARLMLSITVMLAILATMTPAASADDRFVSPPLLREFELFHGHRSDFANLEMAMIQNPLDQEVPLLVSVDITGPRFRESAVLNGSNAVNATYPFRFEALPPGQYEAVLGFTYVQANQKPSITVTFEVLSIPGQPRISQTNVRTTLVEWDAPEVGEVQEYRVHGRDAFSNAVTATVDGNTRSATVRHNAIPTTIWVEAVMNSGDRRISRLSPKLEVDFTPPPPPTPKPPVVIVIPPAKQPVPPTSPTPVPPAPAADTIPPTISTNAPATVSRFGAPTSVTYQCDDNVAVVSCTGSISSPTTGSIAIATGAVIDTSAQGTQTVSVTATDAAGNTVTETTVITVDWSLTGRYAGTSGNEAIVARYYVATFGRQPDAGGFQFWSDRLANEPGANQAIAEFFVTSNEFNQTYGGLNNGQFIDTIYRNILGRAPESGGRIYWLEQIESGNRTRGDVMSFFANSDEHKDITGTN